LNINAKERELLRQYLLGPQTEADLSRVEERLMSDTELFEELLMLEDEVIDQYVRGQMSNEDRASFERHFLQSPERREQLRFGRALANYVDLVHAASSPGLIKDQSSESLGADALSKSAADQSTKPEGRKRQRLTLFWPFQNPALSWAIAAVVLVGMVGAAWFIVRNLSTPVVPGKVFAVTVTPSGLTRDGGQIQTLSIPPSTDTVRLQLALPLQPFQEYSIRLMNGSGASVWQADRLRSIESSGNTFLEVDVPASLLKPDYYRVKLQGRSTGPAEELPSYNFRVN
jgi:anti-sigma factor RsiW